MYTCVDLYKHNEMYLLTRMWPLLINVTSTIHKFSFIIIIILLRCIILILFNESAKFTLNFLKFKKLYIHNHEF